MTPYGVASKKYLETDREGTCRVGARKLGRAVFGAEDRQAAVNKL
jgi:hypothetical protein